MKEEEDDMEGNRNDRYRSVKALAFGEGPRKSYLVSYEMTWLGCLALSASQMLKGVKGRCRS